MIRQKIVTQCSLIRLPGYPDNTVINYVFSPLVFFSEMLHLIYIYITHTYIYSSPSPCWLSKKEKKRPLYFYCNNSLIERGDSGEGVLCGSTYQCYQLISWGQLLAAVVFSLITPCQYANKLPGLLVVPRRVRRI